MDQSGINHSKDSLVGQFPIQTHFKMWSNRPVANLQMRGCKVYAISYKSSTFPAAWVCGQSYASNSHAPSTSANMDPYRWKHLVLAACFWGSDIGM